MGLYDRAAGTVASPPNFFDQSMDLARTQEMQRRQGADPNTGYLGYYDRGNAASDLGQQAMADSLGMYQAQALGQGGPSLAQLQLQQQGQQQMAQALAMGSRGRGGNIAGMQQQALGAQQYGAQQLNMQQAQLRAAEQQQAQAAAAQLAGQMSQQGLAYNNLGLQAQLGSGQQTLDWYLGRRGLDQQRDQANKQWMLGLTQAGAGLVGGLMGGASMMSDERVKTGIRDGGLAATEAVGELQPKTYEYKPGYGPPGERVGPMAQDLQRTPAGAALVTDTPLGKTVDVGGLAALGVAAASEQQHELEALRAQVQQLSGMIGVDNGASTLTQQHVRQGLGM